MKELPSEKHRVKRTYADGSRHVVYYVRTLVGLPYCQLGWDNSDLSKMVADERDLSVFVKPIK